MAAKSSDSTKNLLSLKSVCIVTGASRGLGRSMVVNIGSKLPEGSLVVALSRGLDGLAETKNLMTSSAPEVSCVIHAYDQGSLDQTHFDSVLQECFQGISPSDFDQAMIFHNAGSLESDLCRDLHDVNKVSRYMNINVAGLIALNAQFMKIFKDVPSKVVVNTSSLSAIQAMPSWSLYCTAKAARDMYMKNITEEESDYRVLNYAPGPLDTHMYRNIGLKETKHEKQMEALKNMEKFVLMPDTTVKRLIGILEKNEFENGAHVDYFDEQ